MPPPDLPHPQEPLSLAHRSAVLALFLASGVSGLIYEILWVRQLTLVFGATVFAVSAVLAVFMAGLGLGGYLLGKVADRYAGRALALYGVLEVGIGVYALCVPMLITCWTPVYAWARGQFGMTFWGLNVLKLFAMVVVLLPATLLMGGTFPALVRHVVRKQGGLSQGVALLYGVNTLGAVVGCIATAFALVAALGVVRTLHLAVAINVVAGLCALVMGRTSSSHPAESEEDATCEGENTASQSSVLWLYAVCGFCALGYEALWTRMLAHVVGTDVQAFATMLTAFLLGITLGSLAISGVGPARRHALGWLAGIEVLVGSAALLSIPAFAFLPQLWRVPAGEATSGQLLGWAQCLIVMVIPAILMGAAFPLASHAYRPAIKSLGSGVGKLYMANTLAAVLGSATAGFVLVPTVGAQTGVCVLACVNGAAGLGFAVLASKGRVRPRVAALSAGGLVVAACLCIAAQFVGAPLTHYRRPPDEFDLIHYEEGVSSSVAVLRSRFDPTNKELDVNGVPVAVTNYEDFKIQKLLVHLPLLLHPDPQEMLLIGFGTGSTAYGASLHGGQVTCVELERGQLGAAEHFPEMNREVLKHPRFQLFIDDGRNWLLTVPKQYDVICRDTLHPKLCQDLFSREFYELCRRRLRPGGLMSGILPIDLCPSEEHLKQLIRTFQSVFPHASLWYVGPQLALLVGGTDPLRIDYHLVAQRYEDPWLRADLAIVDLQDPLSLLSYLLLAGDGLEAYTGPGVVTVDNRPLGFWRFQQRLPKEEAVKITGSLVRLKESASAYLSAAPAPGLATAERAAKQVMQARLRQSLGEWRPSAQHFERALAILPDDANAKRGCSRVYNKLAQGHFGQGRIREAERLLREAVRLDPAFAQPYLGLAECLARRGLSPSMQ